MNFKNLVLKFFILLKNKMDSKMSNLTPKEAIVSMLEHLEAFSSVKKIKDEIENLKKEFKPDPSEVMTDELNPFVAMYYILEHLELIPKNRKLKDEIRDLKISFRR